MKLMLVNQSEVEISEAFLTKWTESVGAELTKNKIWTPEQSRLELTVVCLDATAAKKINWQFRGKDYATDVLSFESMEAGSLGELVICPQVLQKQAEEHKQTFNLEMGYMILHGILHLLGHDHEKSEDAAAKMFKIQDDIFDKLRRSETPAKKTAAKKAAAAGKPAAKKVAPKSAKKAAKKIAKKSAKKAVKK